MSSEIPKAVLYYAPQSIWASVALLTLSEKGYGEDELDLRIVDLGKGENFVPSFLRLNPKATVPTLVVPLQPTLASDVESRYKALTDTKSVAEFLDKSRSSISRTSTTSSAPAPSLSPATIEGSALSQKIIADILHGEGADPNLLTLLNARDDASLRELAKIRLPFLTGRVATLDECLSQATGETTHVSQKVQGFWKEKLAGTQAILEVFKNAEKSSGQLSPEERNNREDYLDNAKAAWGKPLRESVKTLNAELEGPYALGDQISLADLHLAAWLARLVKLSGGSATDNGSEAIAALEAHIGDGFSLAKTTQKQIGPLTDTPKPVVAMSKLAVFWDAIKERQSWQKVYREGLH